MENNNDNIIMSRIAFERMQSKDEKNDKWRNLTIIILIVLLVVTNAMWLWAWNQYDYVEEYTEVEASQDGDGVNMAGAGDLYYGADSKGNTQNTVESEE